MNDNRLWQAGVSDRELTCTDGQVTPEILAVLPDGATTAPDLSRGFGLSGRAGIGKTGAMVAFARAAMSQRPDPIPSRMPTSLAELESQHLARDIPARTWLRWFSWPETVNRMRVLSMQNGGIAEVSDIVEDARTARILILDDLGSERIKGSYLDDWAASQLDLIVDGRYRDMRPTWFTTGLSVPELVEKYGQRLFSRLCGESPVIVLPNLPDRRRRAG